MNKIINYVKNYPNRSLLITVSISFLLYTITTIFLSYNILLWHSIESFIRYSIVIFIIVLNLVLLLSGINTILRRKKKSYFEYIGLIIFLLLIQFIGSCFINRAYTSINKISKTEINYTTALITLKDSNINKLSDLKNKKIGMINDKSNIEGYVISKEIINDNKLSSNNTITEYDSFLSIVNDLYDKEIDAAFIPSGYKTMFLSIDRFEEIGNDTKIITTKSKALAKTDSAKPTTNNEITKPFSILLMGVDSDTNDITNGSFNGDTLILITFNPKTYNATMLSIPRDTFVPIACTKNKTRFKINSASWYGTSCMLDTITNLTGIPIDYYVKINFKGVVQLVDSIGGIYVNVPYSLCEQNSNRQWGNNAIFINSPGYQTLNGEQALALSRNRHKPNDSTYVGSIMAKVCPTYNKGARNDFIRSQNQQLVIKAALDKLKDIRDINTVYKILDIVQKNIDTNLTTNQILSFYNIGKEIMTNSVGNKDIISFDRLYLTTSTEQIYDAGMKLKLDDEIYSINSLKDISDAMKINLGLKDSNMTKSFSFSINTPYEQPTIGKGSNYKVTFFPIVPDFTSKYTHQSAENWGANNNITIKFNTIDSSDSKYSNGQIIKQSIPAATLVDLVNKNTGITLTIINKINTTPTKLNCELSENENNSLCKVPDFKTISEVNTWTNSIIMNFMLTKTSTTTLDESLNGKVISQSVKAGTKVIDMPHELTIEYYKYSSDLTDGED